MATKTVVTLVDDLTGEEGEVESVSFGLDGVSFEIDLVEETAAALREVLAPYVAAGRRTGGRARPGSAGRQTGRAKLASVSAAPAATSSGSKPDGVGRKKAQEIRAWARSIGLQIADRGRIPAEVVERYQVDQKRKRKSVPA